VKVDVDRSRASAVRLGVRAVPNFVLVRDGRVVEQIVGAVPRSRLVQAIEDVLRG
jgi:thioredoxin 1